MDSQIFFQCTNIMFEFFYYILFYFKSEQNISFENFVNNPCFFNHPVYIYIYHEVEYQGKRRRENKPLL